MPNEFNVIKYKDSDKDTLTTVSIGVSAARFYFETFNTDAAFIQIKITQLEPDTEVTMEISATPAWSSEEVERVHFAIKDDSDNTLSKRQEVFETITPNDGFLIPVTYLKSIAKIVIDLEVTGANQNTELNIGAGFDSKQ